MTELDNCNRAKNIRKRIQNKDVLFRLYHEFYSKYIDCIKRCPDHGVSLEIGSGAGFLKDIAPDVVTTDILPYETVDIVMDASKMPFGDRSIKSVFMLNVLHHIPDSKAFFNELVRCLIPGGRVLLIDQYHGWLSRLIFQYAHHELYDPKVLDWNFKTSGPLSGANGALCWMIFYRDRVLFEELYPSLELVNLTPNTPFRYWLSGGLKWWCVLPSSLFALSTKFDNWLSKKFPKTSSFVEVELIKK
ncbi:MAG: class I SAM-dependent methyltransferase [Desulfocapsaceae bacterium]|nr:class I SAM-dependent methyltransferase [Desulfocapsaceae bacterium]